MQNRLIKYHGEDSIELIKENPYELVTFGMSFKDVDHLALNYFDNIDHDSDTRLAASVRQAMTNICKGNGRPGSGGHTYVDDKKKLVKEVYELIGKDNVDKALDAGKRLASYVTFKQIEDSFFHHDLLLVETAVARYIASLVTKPTGNWSAEQSKALEEAINDLPYELTSKQNDAVLTSMYNHVSLITGGAGTGKTTVTRTVLKAYDEMGYEITAVALSGRAAMRLHQSIGYKAATIAKFLRQAPLEDYDFEGSELKHVLVIDESSMVDIVSLYLIINHITPNCRLIFVGDPHQLPPIGSGLVLSELDEVDSIEKTHLDIVKRQEARTGIPEYSLSIRNGQVPNALSVGSIEHHDIESYETVVDLYCREPGDTMVVAATKASVDKINIKLQKELNQHSPEFSYQDNNGQWYSVSGSDTSGHYALLHLRLNDPVIFTQNNYEAGYQNGSLGSLTSIQQDKAAGTYGTVKLADNGEEIHLTLTMLDHLRAAYAITLHKAQGSQFSNCIVYLDKTTMVDRSWLYTAVTRSEERLHIVGTTNRFKKAVKSESAYTQRNAHLAWLIEQYIELMNKNNRQAA